MSVNKGMRNPPLMVAVFTALSLVSSASVAWGIWSMRTAGETTANGPAIGAN